MPIYEYACTNCGERSEARQSFTDPPLETCEICGGKLRKLYSPVGIVFKGTGFYATDARKASSSSSSSGDSQAETKTEKKTDKQASSGGETKKKSPSSKSD
ncbi:MAG: FmdB family transcriptional regulator [Actinobacteria bacterium]|nr:FmdB family transcriptional regulator [Actinomycetota bacterium]